MVVKLWNPVAVAIAVATVVVVVVLVVLVCVREAQYAWHILKAVVVKLWNPVAVVVGGTNNKGQARGRMRG